MIPVSLMASGTTSDLDALLDEPSNLAMAPVSVAALVVVRATPARLPRGLVGGRRSAIAGLLQATSLPAGLLSVLLLPAAGLALSGPRRSPLAPGVRTP